MYALNGDSLYNLWLIARWSGLKSLVSFASPNTDLNHILLPSQPLIDLQGRIFANIFSPTAAYNIIVALGFILTFAAAYLLARKFLKSSLAAILVGICVSFLPTHMADSQLHLNMVSPYWMLFFTYFLVLLWQKKTWPYALLTGLFGTLTLLDNYQYGFFALIIALTFCAYVAIASLVRKKGRDLGIFLGYLVISLAFTMVLLAIFDHPFFLVIIGQGALTNLGPARDVNELKVYSAYWMNYLLPSPFLRFFSAPFQSRFASQLLNLRTNEVSQTLYLGWLTIAGATGGLIVSIYKKNYRFFAGFFLLLAIVSLYLSFAYKSYHIFGLTLPSPAAYLFHRAPVIRVYGRFGLIVGIALAFLFGILADYLFVKTKSKAWRIALFALITAAVLVQFWPKNAFPILQPNKIDQTYSEIAAINDGGPVADYPYFAADEPLSYEYLAGQMIHLHPLLYGSTVGTEGDNARKEMLNIQDKDTVSRLIQLGVKYVILHKDLYLADVAWKTPSEVSNGIIPQITDTRLSQVFCSNRSCLYKITNGK
jgi:hypothetical protein